MRTLALTALILALASTAAIAQGGRTRHERAWFERIDEQQAAAAYAAPATNKRPDFAAQVGANGQGVQ